MDKSDITEPLSVSDRRRNSETNHIVRIRKAYAGRQFRPWGIFQEKKGFPLIPEEQRNRRFSLDTELTRRFQFRPSQDFDDKARTIKSLQFSTSNLFQRLYTEEKMKLKKPVLTRSKTKSVKPVGTRSMKRFKKETTGKQKKSVSKLNPTKNKNFSTVPKTKTSTSRDNNKLKNIKHNSKSKKQEKVRTIQHSNSTEKDLITLAQWLQENIETLERPITPKDLVILKLLDGLKIPKRGKRNGQTINYERNEKYPIQILRGSMKPFSEQLSVPVKNMYKEPRKKTGSVSTKVLSEENSKKQRFTKGDRGIFHKSSSSESAELASEKGDKEKLYLEKGTSEEFETSNNTSLLNKTEEIYPEAEMHITELGKLQIILNLKSFKSEDAAVIIWLNEIPRSHMKPDYRKRLSITSLSELQQPEKPIMQKSISSPELEDVASSKPQIYFLPVTILKNLAVDSKGEMRDLKDTSSAVFYKRCNLIHVDSVHS